MSGKGMKKREPKIHPLERPEPEMMPEEAEQTKGGEFQIKKGTAMAMPTLQATPSGLGTADLASA